MRGKTRTSTIALEKTDNHATKADGNEFFKHDMTSEGAVPVCRKQLRGELRVCCDLNERKKGEVRPVCTSSVSREVFMFH
ncbi:hypothetical protein GWI33_008410 [Rhynchophorus ferrugineus]|uniref:Uncharacterized protein n=1 Tax=Rhynchophorus ferrugineus TaxID=354439 RepID=A0A834IGS6_RHYFE|nr:hypothetical protein GWI33_008410 [Rhynchophorus ferrugineus]